MSLIEMRAGEAKPDPSHLHDWERGRHMAEAFGVNGRRYHCAICGVPRDCWIDPQGWCLVHGGRVVRLRRADQGPGGACELSGSFA